MMISKIVITQDWDLNESLAKQTSISSIDEMKSILKQFDFKEEEINGFFRLSSSYKIGRKYPHVIQRFFTKIKIDEAKGCWLYQGGTGGHIGLHAYGRFWYNERFLMAHRFSYEFFNKKKIQLSNQIDHLCNNPICVNPKHLREISGRENTLRNNNPMGINSRKTECLRGHPLSGKNLYLAKNGTRKCKMCLILRARKYRSEKKKKIIP